MIIIRVKRKTVFIVIMAFIFLTGSLFVSNGFRGHFIRNGASEEPTSAIISHMKNAENSNLTAYLSASANEDHEMKYIEIFDIKKGEVIKRSRANFTMQVEARRYIDNITGVYVKAKAFPDNGYIIRIPFDICAEIHNKWFNGLIKEVFVIFTEAEKPYLLVLDDKNRPLFYEFKGDTQVLLKGLDFDPIFN